MYLIRPPTPPLRETVLEWRNTQDGVYDFEQQSAGIQEDDPDVAEQENNAEQEDDVGQKDDAEQEHDTEPPKTLLCGVAR